MRLVVQAVLTAAVVAVGLFVYDGMRPHPDAGDPAVASPAARDGAVEARLARLEERTAGPVLVGAPLEDRVAALERAVAAKVVPGTPAGEGTPRVAADLMGERASRSDAGAPLPVSAEAADGEPLDERELARFRAYLDEAQRRQREEQMTNSLRGMLKSLDLRLNEEQEKGVVAETMKFQGKVRDLWRSGMPRDDASRQEMNTQVTKLREEWSQTIYALLPAAEAEKVVTSMGRVGGMGMGEWRGPPTAVMPVAPGR